MKDDLAGDSSILAEPEKSLRFLKFPIIKTQRFGKIDFTAHHKSGLYMGPLSTGLHACHTSKLAVAVFFNGRAFFKFKVQSFRRRATP
jgi:hypothetical protein